MIAASITSLILGKVVFAVTGLAVGVQLVRHARREGGFGVQGLAVAAIFIGGFGLVAIPVGEALAPASPGPEIATAGEIFMRVGMALLAAFIWRVFRPGGLLGKCLFATCLVALFGSVGWDLSAQPRTLPYDDSALTAHLNQLAIALPFVWASLESGAQWLQARKRIALGLTSLGVSRRFLLWAITCGAFVGVAMLAILAGVARSNGASSVAAFLQIARAVLYLFISGSICIGFFRSEWLGEREQQAPQTS